MYIKQISTGIVLAFAITLMFAPISEGSHGVREADTNCNFEQLCIDPDDLEALNEFRTWCRFEANLNGYRTGIVLPDEIVVQGAGPPLVGEEADCSVTLIPVPCPDEGTERFDCIGVQHIE